MINKPDLDSRISHQVEELKLPHHPDQQALIDWGTFGPKDPRIEQLVWELAHDHGLRLAEIEALIVATLEAVSQRHEISTRSP